MDRGAGASMDASQDGWDWEVLPDHRSSSNAHDSMNLDGVADAHEPVDECKDIGVVPEETKPSKEESMPNVTDLMASDRKVEEAEEEDEEEKAFHSTDDEKVVMQESAPCQVAEEEEDIKKNNKARPECVVFSVGKLKVNGIGALCSFGVVAATVCIFLIGGKLQHHHRQQQQQKIQFYGDDKRIHQVVQQTSRLNQAMSSVMGAGASTRANISFGGFYHEF